MSIHTLLQVVVSLKLWHSGVTLVSGYKPIKTSGSSTDGLYTRKIERRWEMHANNNGGMTGTKSSDDLLHFLSKVERNKEEQEGYKTRKERPSVNPGLLLLLEVQLLQCGYDRKKSH
ncbi:hypothetical protein D6C99_06531 [Aureobasidium pullulans]|nr:hypothetical protein D6C99_06531 [Aureobasidium pullulans]